MCELFPHKTVSVNTAENVKLSCYVSQSLLSVHISTVEFIKNMWYSDHFVGDFNYANEGMPTYVCLLQC